MKRRLGLSAVALLLAVGALAGCGGGNSDDRGMMDGKGGAMHGGAGGDAAPGGRALFRAECGGCHALAAAGTGGSIGPDLDQALPTYDRVLREVTDGGGGMPAFANSLSRSQIEAIARFVSNATP